MADLDVIFDSGRTVPAAPYLALLVNADPYARGDVMPDLEFPITSRLAPGLLDNERQVFDPLWLVQPIFLLGADQASLRWLGFNHIRMLQINAWGLVMQAGNAGQFRAIQSIAPELKFAPSQGDWLDAHLLSVGVPVYPILIDTDGMARQILSDDRYGPSGVAFNAPVKSQQPMEAQP